MMRNPSSSVAQFLRLLLVAVSASNQSGGIPFVIFSPTLAQNANSANMVCSNMREFVSNCPPSRRRWPDRPSNQGRDVSSIVELIASKDRRIAELEAALAEALRQSNKIESSPGFVGVAVTV